MTWKPVRVADLDAESQRRAEENMNFWIGRGLPTKPKEEPPKTENLRQIETNDWYKQGKECPF